MYACAAVFAAGTLPAHAAATPATLTLYAGQHQQMVRLVVKAFEQQTGIPVKVRYGEGPELANAIILEGKRTPADLYFTENSPELMRLQEKQLLAPVAPATLQQIPAHDSSAKGDWVGVVARENVLTYNPKLIQASALPKSLLDLADPKYKGKVAIAPTDSDFLPLVRIMAVKYGRARTLKWLRALKQDAQLFQDDEGVAAAVHKGAAAFGDINDYYYYRLREQVGKRHMVSRVYHFRHGDPGGLINVSGAAVLRYAHHPAEAQKFLAFLVSAKTQTLLAQSTVDFEYPLRPGIAANPQLKPLSQLQPPQITVEQLGNDDEALQLLQEAGVL
ncbi:MAG TPA: extracellular solute-binding protein [Nevskiaceae bacterium]|nr:extracellular solute-binding protein [Nevskiaceae bacterium]